MLRRALVLLLAFSFWPTHVLAQEPLVVAIKEAPPFVVKTADGIWSGPAVDLWERAASVLKRPTSYVEKDLAGLLDAVESGEVDVAVGALSVTGTCQPVLDSHFKVNEYLSCATAALGSVGKFT